MEKVGWSSILVAAMLLAVGVIAEAQQPKKVPRIGRLSAGFLSLSSGRDEALKQGLRDRGYIEGKNIFIETRYAEGKPDRYPTLVAELVRLKIDVLVTASGPARAAKQVSNTLPIVVVGTTDPMATGLVESLARPGGNVTGLTSLAPELGGKRLELLKETVPKLSRVAFLYNPADSSNVIELEQLRGPAAALGVMLRVIEARRPDEIEHAFSMMIRERVEGLSTASGAVNNNDQRRIVEMAAKNRLPAVYHLGEFVDSGGLMSYGPNLGDMYRRAAYFVDRILKGAKPADLPVEQPTKFELLINLKTAKALGLTIPPVVMMRAERVIK
jgi:putative tryptophan/tyrosine transport system substrate-binding protein